MTGMNYPLPNWWVLTIPYPTSRFSCTIYIFNIEDQCLNSNNAQPLPAGIVQKCFGKIVSIKTQVVVGAWHSPIAHIKPIPILCTFTTTLRWIMRWNWTQNSRWATKDGTQRSAPHDSSWNMPGPPLTTNFWNDSIEAAPRWIQCLVGPTDIWC